MFSLNPYFTKKQSKNLLLSSPWKRAKHARKKTHFIPLHIHTFGIPMYSSKEVEKNSRIQQVHRSEKLIVIM